nr:hypothetical protein [uncultured Halomonas sp.]|tara:strand:- start:1505 stop:1723 length:219 start_codon:yes stop_codon:yes gene_type:complete
MLNKRWQHIRHYKLSLDVDTDALDKLIASVADFFEFPIALVPALGQNDGLSGEMAYAEHIDTFYIGGLAVLQ